MYHFQLVRTYALITHIAFLTKIFIFMLSFQDTEDTCLHNQSQGQRVTYTSNILVQWCDSLSHSVHNIHNTGILLI